jgi:hypothetical protein
MEVDRTVRAGPATRRSRRTAAIAHRCATAGITALALAVMAAAAAQDAAPQQGQVRKIGPLMTVGDLFQQSSSTTSLQPPAPAFCNNSYECFVLFPKVDRGHRVVTHMSCTASTTSPSVYEAVLLPLRPDGSIIFRQQYAPIPKVSATHNLFVMNTPTLALFAPGEQPAIAIRTKSFAQVSALCTIAGHVVPPS